MSTEQFKQNYGNSKKLNEMTGIKITMTEKFF